MPGAFRGATRAAGAVVILLTLTGGTITLGQGAAEAAPPPVSFAPRVDYQTGSISQRGAAADVNGDSRLDLLVTNSESNGVSVLLGNGAGGFAADTEFPAAKLPMASWCTTSTATARSTWRSGTMVGATCRCCSDMATARSQHRPGPHIG